MMIETNSAEETYSFGEKLGKAARNNTAAVQFCAVFVEVNGFPLEI